MLNCFRSKKPCPFVISADELRSLARKAGRKEVIGFNYNCKNAPGYWPYPSPRPRLKTGWEYRLHHSARSVNHEQSFNPECLSLQIFLWNFHQLLLLMGSPIQANVRAKGLSFTKISQKCMHTHASVYFFITESKYIHTVSVDWYFICIYCTRVAFYGFSSLHGIASMVRLLYACIRWDDMLSKPPSGGTNTTTTDTDITTREVLARRDVEPQKLRSEYRVRTIVIPLNFLEQPTRTGLYNRLTHKLI